MLHTVFKIPTVRLSLHTLFLISSGDISPGAVIFMSPSRACALERFVTKPPRHAPYCSRTAGLYYILLQITCTPYVVASQLLFDRQRIIGCRHSVKAGCVVLLARSLCRGRLTSLPVRPLPAAAAGMTAVSVLFLHWLNSFERAEKLQRKYYITHTEYRFKGNVFAVYFRLQ